MPLNHEPNTNEELREKGLLLTRKKVTPFLPTSEYQRFILETVDNARIIDGQALFSIVQGKENTFHVNVRRLFDAGYLDRLAITAKLDPTRGRSPAVYALGSRGIAYLQTARKKNAPLKPEWIHHELTVARTFATAVKACRLAGAQLPFWERQFLLPPLKPSRLKLDKPAAYETDAGFEIEHRKTSSFFLEVDNATQPARRLANPNQSDFWKKLLFYEELLRQEREDGAQPLGIGWFRVLTLVPTLARLESLRELAREADPRKDKAGTFIKEGRKTFLFALQRDVQLSDPLRFLFEPIWYLPSDGPFPLFERKHWDNHEE